MQVNTTYEKHRITAAFNRAASTYDNAANLQREVGDILFNMLNEIPMSRPNWIIDLGAGTGFLTKKVLQKYKYSHIGAIDIAKHMVEINKTNNKEAHFIQGDMSHLPIHAETIDLVFSNMSLQWSLNFFQTCTELRRVLKQEGYLLFSTVAKGSLKELHNCQNLDVGRGFLTEAELRAYLVDAKFNPIHFYNKQIIAYYPEVNDIVRGFKEIGANIHKISHRGLVGKAKWQSFKQQYENYRLPNCMLPVTYQIVFCLAKAV